MNIKKVTAAIFTLIAVVLIIGAATILFITSRDEIVSTDIITDFPGSDNPGVGGVIICHETKSGNPVELLVSANSPRVTGEDDGLYRIWVVLNQREDKAYSVENTSFDLAFNNDDLIISSYCSGGGGEYFKPQVDFPDNKRHIVCNFDGNYAEIEIIAKLSRPEEIPMLFTYDISGNGLNSLNEFPDQSCEMIISCDY